MNFNYRINTELNVPIYKQLADAVSFSIKKGELADKSRLPTVQEMSSILGVARGTVKKAYDELEKSGLLEKVQGRGTFVNYPFADNVSRKERAMSAIDGMLDNLSELGFSTAEINIFLNLKLKERAERDDRVKIAVFECNPENLTDVSEQLRSIKHTELYSYLIDSVKQNPYKIEEHFDFVVTTKAHRDEVARLLPNDTPFACVAMRLNTKSLSSLLRLSSGQKAGIVSFSERFCTMLKASFDEYTDGVLCDKPFVLSNDGDIKRYLKDKNVILISSHYEKYCSKDVLSAIIGFKGEIIQCNYKLDDGSILYITEKSKKILNSKSL